MGDYNPSTPVAIGGEWAPSSSSSQVTLDSPLKSVVMRFKGSANTVSAIHAYLANVVGNPGLAVEIVSTLAPTIDASNVFYPATDTGNSVVGWQNQAAGVLSFAQLGSAARFNPTTYGRNTAALAAGATLPMTFRSLGASLVTKRILQVLGGFTAVNTLTGYPTAISAYNVGISADLTIGGTTYNGPQVQIPLNNSWSDRASAANWAIDPSKIATSDPSWTLANVNAIINGTNSFGVTPHGNLAAQALWVASAYCNPIVVPENRMGNLYVFNAPPRIGWNKQTLGATSVLSANTYYWVIISCPNASPTNYAVVPTFNYSTSLQTSTVATTTTQEHRQEAQAQLNTTVGVPSPAPTTVPNYALGVLLDAAGTILSQSQPYVQSWVWSINSAPHDNQTPQTTLVTPGQQVTTPGGGPFSIAGIQVQVYNEASSFAVPSQPLVVSIRSGAGGISGAGVLLGTATLQPNKCVGGAFFGVIPIDGGTVSAASATTYFLEFASTAPAGTGWQIIEADTRSDLATIGGSTVIAVEGASIGGQTDGVINNGALITRYDLGVALITAPTAPAGFTATPSPESVTTVLPGANQAGFGVGTDYGNVPILPPRVLLSWSATSNTTNFLAYKVYRRASALPAGPWVLIATLGIPTGYTATNVEAQHTSFIDYEAPWSVAGTRFGPGVDYAVTVTRADTGFESSISSASVLATIVAPALNSWIVCNGAPWINTPVYVHDGTQDAAANVVNNPGDNVMAYQAQGRDGALLRTRQGTPARAIDLTFEQVGELPAWVFDGSRVASISGKLLRLLSPQGDAYWGGLVFPDTSRPNQVKVQAKAKFLTAAPIPDASRTGYNQSTRIVLNGTSQYATTPTSTLLNPGAVPWSMMVAGVFTNHANDVYLSDGAVAASGAGAFGFWCPSLGQMSARVHGAGATVNLTSALATWFDGNLHVATLVFDGTNYLLYLDDTAVVTTSGTAVGSVTNAIALVAGADNAGASGFTASSLLAWGFWNVGLTPTSVLSTARYLLGYSGYRAAPGATAFYNAADARCWNGIAATLSDLSGNVQASTLVAAPTVKGVPSSLSDLDTTW